MQNSPTVAVVIDIGGTTTRAARFSEDHIDRRLDCPTPTVLMAPDASVEILQQQLVHVVAEMITTITSDLSRNDARNVGRLPVAVTFSGRVDARARSVTSAPDVWGTWATVFGLADALEDRLENTVEVRVCSDVMAAAWRYEQRTQPDHAFALFMARTGLSYVVCDPQAIDHADPVLLGHLPADAPQDSFRCSCGAMNHLSAFVSSAGVANVVMRAALREPKAFRSSALFRFAVQRYETQRFEQRTAALRRHAVRHNVRQHIDEDVWRNMNDRHAELTPGELQRWMYPALLDSGMFIEAVRQDDVFALALLDAVAAPVAQHLRDFVFDRVDVVALAGGFARALGERYRTRIAPDGAQAVVLWAEDDDLGDLRAAKDYLWPKAYDEERVIDLRESALTAGPSTPGA